MQMRIREPAYKLMLQALTEKNINLVMSGISSGWRNGLIPLPLPC